MDTIPQTYRIPPESILKLRLLSVALETSQSALLDLMINTLWEQKEQQVTTIVSQQKVSKESSRILKKLVTK